MRAYASLEDLERREASLYGRDEWRLEAYASIVIEMDDATIAGCAR